MQNIAQIFIGFDHRERAAMNVLIDSLYNNSSIPISITPLVTNQLSNKGIYYRKRDSNQSTDFSFSRFLVPFLMNYKDWALFIDCDMLAYGDIGELWDQRNDNYSIMCAKHNHNPIEETKFLGEKLMMHWFKVYNYPIVSLRFFNVYGPRSRTSGAYGAVFGVFLAQKLSNKPLTVVGNGRQTRDFIHVYDLVAALVLSMKKTKNGEIYNIGCDEKMEYSVMDVAKILIEMLKETNDYDEWIRYVDDRPYNDQRYYISNSKLKNLGWTIKINFIDGLKDLISSTK